jgi:hypothetical protein
LQTDSLSSETSVLRIKSVFAQIRAKPFTRFNIDVLRRCSEDSCEELFSLRLLANGKATAKAFNSNVQLQFSRWLIKRMTSIGNSVANGKVYFASLVEGCTERKLRRNWLRPAVVRIPDFSSKSCVERGKPVIIAHRDAPL